MAIEKVHQSDLHEAVNFSKFLNVHIKSGGFLQRVVAANRYIVQVIP
jgi:hypothetical protein